MTTPGDEPTTAKLPGPWWAVSIAKVREPTFREEAKTRVTADARPLLGFTTGLILTLILGPVTVNVLLFSPPLDSGIAAALGIAFTSGAASAVIGLVRLIRQLGLR